MGHKLYEEGESKDSYIQKQRMKNIRCDGVKRNY